nr:hypothetical protein [Tanacetum cinerariifolium]
MNRCPFEKSTVVWWLWRFGGGGGGGLVVAVWPQSFLEIVWYVFETWWRFDLAAVCLNLCHSGLAAARTAVCFPQPKPSQLVSHIVEDFVKRLRSTLGEEGNYYMEPTKFEIQETDCRGVPRNVNPINPRNPPVRACYECGSTDHVRNEGYVFDIDLIPFGHGSFDVIIGERRKKKARLLMSTKATDKKQGEIVVVRDFLEIFPDDLSGLPPF